MKITLISYDIFELLKIFFNNSTIFNEHYDKLNDEFNDLNIFFKYDICDYLDDFIELNPMYY